jgi:hypothetical protein
VSRSRGISHRLSLTILSIGHVRDRSKQNVWKIGGGLIRDVVRWEVLSLA